MENKTKRLNYLGMENKAKRMDEQSGTSQMEKSCTFAELGGQEVLFKQEKEVRKPTSLKAYIQVDSEIYDLPWE